MSYAWVCQSFSRLPPATNGISLGLCGVLGLWRVLGEHWPICREGTTLTGIFIGITQALAALWLFAYVVKTALAPRVVADELTQPSCVASLCCWPVAVTALFCNRPGELWSADVAFVVLCLGQTLYQVLSCRFIWQCVKLHILPEPATTC